MTTTVSIRTLADDTGESIRSLQNWCDLGVLVAEPSTEKKGRGYHRVFKDDERKWALLAAALNRLRVPLGDVAQFLKELRHRHRPEFFGTGKNAVHRFNASVMARALKSSGDVFMMLCLRPHEGKLLVRVSLQPPLEMMNPDEPGAAEFLAEFVAQQIEFTHENPGCYFLNLSQIWAPLRRSE